MMNILEACADPKLFGPWFKDPATHLAWSAFDAALFGLPMTDEQLELYRKHTGRIEPPTVPQSEAVLITGRRGGKSFRMALIAVYLACFREYRQYLTPGERATVMVIAADRKQARVIVRYIGGMLNGIPMLRKMLAKTPTTEGFDLNNGVTIEVGTASFRATRGYTYAAVLCDEIAFFRTDESAANPDSEILNAIRPGMATIPTAMLIIASSPYAKKGELYQAWKRYYGKDDGPLVWKASTREMNPSVPQSVIDRAYERDPAAASAEYGANFRNDIETFVSREVVEACVVTGVRERGRLAGITYKAFVDPSGGSADSMTLAITHREKAGTVILDATREVKAPFSPESVTADFCVLLKAYGVQKVVGDRYSGEYAREQFRKHGITYEVAAKVRSDLYRDLLPVLNSGKVELLDDDRLVHQICNLERRTGRGKDSIDHAQGQHDDLANAVAGAIDLSRAGSGYNLAAAL